MTQGLLPVLRPVTMRFWQTWEVTTPSLRNPTDEDYYLACYRTEWDALKRNLTQQDLYEF